MKKLLQLKHWQLLLPYLVIVIIDLLFDNSATQVIKEILIILSSMIYFSWIWVSSVQLYTKLPPNTNLNLGLFKLFMIIFIVYIIIISSIFVHISIKAIPVFDYIICNATIIVPIHLFCMFIIFWCLVFFAKIFKTVELQRTVKFSDYIIAFLFISIYPIGIWFIQPKVNRMLYLKPTKPSTNF